MQTAPAKQEVSTLPSVSPRAPQPMSIQLSNALSIAANAAGAGDLTEATLPSGARLGLQTRLRELAAALEFPRQDRVRSIITNLGTMPTKAEDDPAVQRFVLEQYVAICSDVPEWALDWAAWQFLKQEAGTGFRPSAGELRAFAMRRVEGLIAEQQRIDAVLRAKIAPGGKPIDAERRKELADMLRSAGEDLAARGRA